MFQINGGTQIKKYSNGVILENSTYSDGPDSISKVLNFPFNVYITDHESKVVTCNETNAFNNNVASIEDFKGYSILKVVQKKSEGQIIIGNDASVIKSQAMQLFAESYTNINGSVRDYLSVKMPIYSQYLKLIGVLGFSLLWDKSFSSLTEFLNQLNQLSLLPISRAEALQIPISLNRSSTINHEMIELLTSMEFKIVRLSSLGRTAKEISKELNLSHRTIEKHLENARSKACVSSKRDLIRKVLGI